MKKLQLETFRKYFRSLSKKNGKRMIMQKNLNNNYNELILED